MPSFTSSRHHLRGEAAEMRVHHVQRHLAGVEMEAVLRGHVQHAQVNRRILVAGEPDVADLARLLRLEQRLQRAALREEAVRDPPCGCSRGTASGRS